jgi:hypothetical protein
MKFWASLPVRASEYKNTRLLAVVEGLRKVRDPNTIPSADSPVGQHQGESAIYYPKKRTSGAEASSPALPNTGSSQAARSNTGPNIVLGVKSTNIVEVLVKATDPGRGR